MALGTSPTTSRTRGGSPRSSSIGTFIPFPRKTFRAANWCTCAFCCAAPRKKLAAGGPLGRREISNLNQALNVPVWQKLVQNQNGFHAETVPVRSDWTWVIARIAASLGEMLANHEVERIKVCANSDCRWVFYDPTKARTKRWCSDRTCGNRARVRRARAAQKQVG